MPEPSSLTDTDRRVLSYLQDSGADYPALVAGNTGVHIPLVERRISVLVEHGLLERVTGESIYRITADGESALASFDGGTEVGRSTADAE